MKTRRSRSLAFRIGPLLVVGVALLWLRQLESRAEMAPSVDQAAASMRGLRDRAELEAFLDGVMTADLARQHVAGATVAVVKDGQLFFAKGYGYADLDQRKPVDPDTTLFRVGSISKLFTWTAVMQLVEQGKLDLDKDVNSYIDFTIPATFAQPITLSHLLTHTPGFEEDETDLFTEDPARIVPMGKWLPSHRPARVRPPGLYASYSNWAATLAGYIVERVSGMSWDDYIERHILIPLSMTQTTGRQPLPLAFSADMSQGYRYEGGRFVSRKWENLIGVASAGAVSSTATDIARFMLAHLNRGEYNGQRILSQATTTRMQSRLHGHDARLPGFAHGFYEQSSHGLRVIGHGGDTMWFHSNLALLPSENVGVFVSYNTDTGGDLSFSSFLQTFLDHYYPGPRTMVRTLPTAQLDATRVEGEYRFNRRNFTTYQKFLAIDNVVPVVAGSDGSIVVRSRFGEMRMVEVDALLYRSEAGNTLLAFESDSSGDIVRGFLSIAPMIALDRQSFLQSPRLHRIILIGGLVLFGALLLAAMVQVFYWRSLPSFHSGLLVGIAAAHIVFAIAWALLDLGRAPGRESAIAIALAFPVVGAMLTLGALWPAITRWRAGTGTAVSRLAYGFAVIVAVLYVWSLNTWNLLGWRM